VEGYGGIVHDCQPNQTARETTAAAVLESTGGTLIPPYDHPDIIAGQGTAALELMDQVDELDTVIAPIGGGGLMAGTCIAVHGLDPAISLIGAEPSGADDAARSLRAGELIPQTGPDTICDGLLTSLGRLTWPIIAEHVASILTVSDAQVIEAMALVWQRMKLIIEPSAAVPVAAVLGRPTELAGSRRVGVVLSGGNVDFEQALRWMAAESTS
jgi:threonine dehydratase